MELSSENTEVLPTGDGTTSNHRQGKYAILHDKTLINNISVSSKMCVLYESILVFGAL